MTSSSLEPPTYTTGAHRASRRAPRSGPRTLTRTMSQCPPARYEPYLDGLFTYCLSVLGDHDVATAVLGDVLAIAERQFGRCPADETGRRAWLYALARWGCLRELGERRRGRQRTGAGGPGTPTGRPGAHTGRPGTRGAGPADAPEEEAPGGVTRETAERRRGDLVRLAWPEAAGTTPEQREALELAVRHQLGAQQVAAVLGLPATAARELLSAAACEVERTRAALSVVETGSCPSVARLAGDHQVLLSATLRRELVRHVDDCPRCRRAAERAGAGGPWPGSAVTPARLPLVEAPRAATYVAMLHVPRTRAGGPRFGRDGFPLDPKDDAARRDRLRARALTTTVVAAVVAAPVFALWATHRGAPVTGEGRGGPAISVGEEDRAGGATAERRADHYENAGSAARTGAAPGAPAAGGPPAVSVEVITPTGARGPGRLTVRARPAGGDITALTLTASGDAPVEWSLWSDASWLHASGSSGTLAPGRSVTVYVSVDRDREPHGPWTARVGVEPAGAVVEIHGRGADRPPSQDPGPGPVTPPATAPPSQDPSPTAPPSSQDPSPAPPTSPPPSPDPAPSDTPPPVDPSAPPPAPPS
ncbi:BACON domain-containing protein [Streptomyces sp. HMX112]|uniref:BACON domain-containing protein n=1 Tax=Streptomyces sp. HMX112 TaxID=3390850 RepID=UPI003A80F176